jgi:heme/copper-type cytochrome/quinol oxidase subunit 3
LLYRQVGGPCAPEDAIDLSRRRYAFWIFLLSEIVMFSAFFATFAVLVDATAGGPSPTRSAFLSAFFTLVGCHGLHVTAAWCI